MPDASPENPHASVLTERKSKFITKSCRCRSSGEAREFVARIRDEFPDATHHCWAFVACEPGSTREIGSSDDGEPRGTAGKPILNVLLRSGLGEVCSVVSRWFGGVKLGTAGLVRAYGQCALENLATLPRAQNIVWVNQKIRAPYRIYDSLLKLIEPLEIKIIDSSFQEDALLTLAVPEDRLESFKAAFDPGAPLSGAKIEIGPANDERDRGEGSVGRGN